MSLAPVIDGSPRRYTAAETRRRQKLANQNRKAAQKAYRTPVVTAPRPKAPAPKLPAPRPVSSGPSQAELARQAERRAAQRQREAEARARRAANNAARQSATTDIERLNAEITAARARMASNTNQMTALKRLVGTGSGSHAAVRDNALRTLDQALEAKLAQIQQTFDSSMSDFRTNLRDNEAEESDSSFANLTNRGRERGDLVTQALSQGAGESDVLRAQMQALRNWSANQGDINRAFFDTRSSINAGITDLNESTQTGMINEELSTNAARASRWDDYFEAQADTYSDLANLDSNQYLLQAEIDALRRQRGVSEGLLSWLDEGKNAEDYKAPKLKSTKSTAPPKYESEYARLAAEAAGSHWEDPGISEATQNWQGGNQSTGGLNSAEQWNLQANVGPAGPGRRRRPEGATLRRW